MEKLSISQDDLYDVAEKTDRLERYIEKSLKDVELSLAMSALISASVNCIVSQCKTRKQILIYRQLVNEMFECAIKNVNNL